MPGRSMVPPPGRMERTKGPPLLKRQLAVPASGWPEGTVKPGTRLTVQRTPGGRSFSKSKTHCFSFTQRPLPLAACASLQLTDSGAAAPASPKRTAASSNLATTCRTRATSPCGTRLLTCTACAAELANEKQSAASAVAAVVER